MRVAIVMATASIDEWEPPPPPAAKHKPHFLMSLSHPLFVSAIIETFPEFLPINPHHSFHYITNLSSSSFFPLSTVFLPPSRSFLDEFPSKINFPRESHLSGKWVLVASAISDPSSTGKIFFFNSQQFSQIAIN